MQYVRDISVLRSATSALISLLFYSLSLFLCKYPAFAGRYTRSLIISTAGEFVFYRSTTARRGGEGCILDGKMRNCVHDGWQLVDWTGCWWPVFFLNFASVSGGVTYL